jgi:hypothetical protein
MALALLTTRRDPADPRPAWRWPLRRWLWSGAHRVGSLARRLRRLVIRGEVPSLKPSGWKGRARRAAAAMTAGALLRGRAIARGSPAAAVFARPVAAQERASKARHAGRATYARTMLRMFRFRLYAFVGRHAPSLGLRRRAADTIRLAFARLRRRLL